MIRREVRRARDARLRRNIPVVLSLMKQKTKLSARTLAGQATELGGIIRKELMFHEQAILNNLIPLSKSRIYFYERCLSLLH